MLKISRKKGGTAIAPTLENAQKEEESQRYPITRPLYIYTAGEAQGAVKDFLDWILGPEGQEVVQELGYIPVSSDDPASNDEPVSSDE